MLQDYHIHTTYGQDAESSAGEIILTAIDRGFSRIGFSDHSYTWFDDSWCMKKENVPLYLDGIRALAEEYRGKIEILCGVEQDYWSEESTEPFDYAIGSVHYLKAGDAFLPVDEGNDYLARFADEYFNGDIYLLTELYFETVGNVVERTDCDYIGHFDLISKFNTVSPLFDEKNERYRSAWKSAADKLLGYGRPFEINTGAMNSGYREAPYPSPEIFEYLRANGAEFILSSDAHKAENIGRGFEKAGEMYSLN